MLEPFTPAFYKRLQQLKIRTRRAFLGSRQGSHRSLRKGHGLEFADYRHYAPGDDFRHIDWGVYGRTDRLYVREFREEQDLNVIFLIDTSASMGQPPESGKFELACNLALSLGYVALTDGDAVTLSLLGQRNTPRFVTPAALSRARKELENAVPGGSFIVEDEVRAAIARQRIPGKCFFISDFFADKDDIFAALDLLRAKNFDITLIHILSPAELRLDFKPGSAVVVDSETLEEVVLSLDTSSARTYATLLAEHVEAIEQYCREAGVTHVLVSSADSVTDIVLTRLPELGLLK